MTVHDSREAKPRVEGGTWEAAFVTALESGQVRRSTPEAEESFAAARRAGPGLHIPAGIPLATSLPARVLTAGIGAQLSTLRSLLKGRGAGRPRGPQLPAARSA